MVEQLDVKLVELNIEYGRATHFDVDANGYLHNLRPKVGMSGTEPLSVVWDSAIERSRELGGVPLARHNYDLQETVLGMKRASKVSTPRS